MVWKRRAWSRVGTRSVRKANQARFHRQNAAPAIIHHGFAGARWLARLDHCLAKHDRCHWVTREYRLPLKPLGAHQLVPFGNDQQAPYSTAQRHWILRMIKGPVALELATEVQTSSNVGQRDEGIDGVHMRASKLNSLKNDLQGRPNVEANSV